uniref:ARAD1B18216p n=1 Tax=Blastobotrys adeninivorans TaxID=409370 RepID=A0A060T6D5_BLAAD
MSDRVPLSTKSPNVHASSSITTPKRPPLKPLLYSVRRREGLTPNKITKSPILPRAAPRIISELDSSPPVLNKNNNPRRSEPMSPLLLMPPRPNRLIEHPRQHYHGLALSLRTCLRRAYRKVKLRQEIYEVSKHL